MSTFYFSVSRQVSWYSIGIDLISQCMLASRLLIGINLPSLSHIFDYCSLVEAPDSCFKFLIWYLHCPSGLIPSIVLPRQVLSQETSSQMSKTMKKLPPDVGLVTLFTIIYQGWSFNFRKNSRCNCAPSKIRGKETLMICNLHDDGVYVPLHSVFDAVWWDWGAESQLSCF